MKIYGVSVSPFVRKVLITCLIKELNYQLVPINPFGEKPPSFIKISPLGKIPVIKDGHITLPDSSVICAYLEEKYTQNSILPQNIEERAQTRWLATYADTKLNEVAGPKLFYEVFVKPKLLNLPTDEKVVKNNLETTLPSVMDYLNEQVPEQGFLFSTEKLSIADIAIGSNMVNANYANFKVDAEKWPILAHYIERVHNTTPFQEALAMDQKFLNAI